MRILNSYTANISVDNYKEQDIFLLNTGPRTCNAFADLQQHGFRLLYCRFRGNSSSDSLSLFSSVSSRVNHNHSNSININSSCSSTSMSRNWL